MQVSLNGAQRTTWARKLADQGVELRHQRARLFQDRVEESVTPEQASSDLRWFSRNQLQARCPGENWVAVESKHDLAELAALRGLLPLEELPEPQVAALASSLASMGTLRTHSGQPAGAYSLYQSLRGDQKEGHQLELHGQTYDLSNRSQSELLGYFLGCHDLPEQAHAERAASVRALAASGLKSSQGNLMEVYEEPYRWHESGYTLRQGETALLRVASRDLDNHQEFAGRLERSQKLYARLEKQVGPQEARATWANFQLHQDEEGAALLNTLLDRGATRPAALAEWVLASPAVADKLVSAHRLDDLSTAFRLHQVRQKGTPAWRDIERLAGRLRQSGLQDEDMANLARAAEKASPWKLEVGCEATSMVSREISLKDLKLPRLTFLKRAQDELTLEAGGSALSWTTEDLGEGWHYCWADLSAHQGETVSLRVSTKQDGLELRNLKVRGQDKEFKAGLLRRTIDRLAEGPLAWDAPEGLLLQDMVADLNYGYKDARQDGAPVNMQDALPAELRPELKERLVVFGLNRALRHLTPSRTVFRNQEGEQAARRLLALATTPTPDRSENLRYLKALPAPALLEALEKSGPELERVRRNVTSAVLFDDSATLAEKIARAEEEPAGAQLEVRGDAVVLGGVRIKKREVATVE